MSRLRSRVAVVALVASGMFASSMLACDRAPAPVAQAKTWPPGTVLAVDDTPISAGEVDVASVYTQRIEPQSSAPQLRRLALTNIVLPRLLSRLMAPQARADALAKAEAALARVRKGPLEAPANESGDYGEHMTAGWQQLGLVAWGAALELEDGTWSDVLEDVGRFIVLKRIRRVDAPVEIKAQVEADVLIFPWLDAATMRVDVEKEHDKHKLTIVDPSWTDVVPELIQYRMGVHAP